MDWVVVHWSDIVGVEDAWITQADAEELMPAQMITAGWVIKDTEDYLVIASTLEEAEAPLLGNVNVIPKGVIRRIEATRGGDL
jgi:hypothetical protein